ncbi:MAG TPA: catalase, partial [Nitrospira sp.]|nr:catalase [Nitrospira sp.]
TFWDFISLMPESMHMVMWLMSDRAIPRSYRMMEGFGVHTFRFVNDRNKSRFVKFHWKPLLGLHSVVWDEAQKISGMDPDFHRRDLWEAIETGRFPQWELGVQVVEEKDEHRFDFDLLDPTKIIPEEMVPVRRIGRLTLNRNPDNFFAETEQVAFHPGHLVPGIDFSDDPLLQGRLFSYLDTQLLRLGGPNFHEIPINRPIAPAHNNQRDGHMRRTINQGRVSYHPNSLGGGCPMQTKADMGGFVSLAQRLEGQKVRARSEKFFDHFTQAALFWNSQSHAEKAHIVQAFRFELGKVETAAIRTRMLGLLAQVDRTLAGLVAQGLGMEVPTRVEGPMNMSVPADGNIKQFQPKPRVPSFDRSPALSMANTVKDRIDTRKVAFLVADGFDDGTLSAMKKALITAGALAKVVAPRLGTLTGAKGTQVPIDFSLLTAGSVLFDALYIPGGQASVEILKGDAKALVFVQEAFLHCKAIAASDAGVQLLLAAHPGQDRRSESHAEAVIQDPTALLKADSGIIVGRGAKMGSLTEQFVKAIAQHRHWDRELKGQVPA